MKDPAQRQLVDQLSGRNILVVGDVMLDQYVWGRARRISPEAPVPIVELDTKTFRPGGAANVAVGVAALGGTALLAAVVGRDEAGDQLLAELRSRNVTTHGIVSEAPRPTTTKMRVMARAQQVLRIDRESQTPLSWEVEESLLHFVGRQLSSMDACVVSDYGKGVVSPRLAQETIKLARDMSVPVVVDPKGTDYSLYRGATLVKPNKHQLERFVNHEVPDKACLIEAGATLLEILPGTVVLITLGADGMILFREDCEPLSFPTAARSVFDVTGAGDTVTSTLALALAARVSLERAVQLANVAAGIVVGKSGTAAVTADELLSALP